MCVAFECKMCVQIRQGRAVVEMTTAAAESTSGFERTRGFESQIVWSGFIERVRSPS